MCIAHLLEILADFQLHVVADAFVLLDARIELVQVGLAVLIIVQRTRRQVEQFLHHAEHTLHTFCERRDLLLGLKYRKFGSTHEAGSNEVQAEVLFLIDTLRLDNPAYELLNLLDEPDEDKRIGHIEGGMESGKHKAQLGSIGHKRSSINRLLGHIHVVTYPTANEVDEWTEYEENPDYAEHVKEHVSESSATCLGVGRKGSEVRSDCRTDVLTEHKGDTLIDGQCTTRAEDHRDSHHSCTRLYAERQNAAQQQEDEGGEERCRIERREEVQQRFILSQVHLGARSTQCAQA